MGQTLLLGASAQPGSFFNWQGPASFPLYTASVQNPSITNADTYMSGVYSLTLSSAAGCTITASVQASVVATPTLVLSSNSPLCFGANLTMNVAGATTYSWLAPNASYHNGPQVVFNTVNMSIAGTYTVLGTTGPCLVQQQTLVVVNPLPLPIASINNPVCEANPISFAGSGGVLYSWAGPGFASSSQNTVVSSASFSNEGTYTLSVIDANNCNASVTVFVGVLPNPVPLVIGDTVCLGESATMQVSGGTSYFWSGPNAFTSTATTIQIPQVSTLTAGNYTVVVSAFNSCSVQAIAPLVANFYPLPVPVVLGDTSVCRGSALTLTASGGVSYYWHGPNNFYVLGPQVNIAASDNNVAGIYTLSAKNASNCSASSTIMVSVLPLPEAQIVGTNNKHCVPFCSNFTVNALSDSSLVTSVFYFNSVAYDTTLFKQCFSTAGVYTIGLSYSDTNGCVNNASYIVEAFPEVFANYNFSPNEPLAGIDEVEFINSSQGDGQMNWSWFFMANNLDTVFGESCSFLFEDPGKYPVALIVKNQWGCLDTVIKVVTVEHDFTFYVPNAFSPNNDGLNEVFQPKGTGFVGYELEIYDRWGEKIFATTNFLEAWDGRFKGEMCKSDVYNWKIKVNLVSGVSKFFMGKVSLVR